MATPANWEMVLLMLSCLAKVIDRFVMPSVLGIVALCCSQSALAQSFSVSNPEPYLSFQQMQKFGIYWPDTAIGFVNRGHGQYYVFGSGSSSNGAGPGISIVPNGTYKFGGTLEQIAPAQLKGKYPSPSMEIGRLQPAPNGEQFDRDYAGGGPTYVYTVDGHEKLVQIYHGEYHPDYPTFLPFYGGSGMAISDPTGDWFTKIGEILSPHVTLAQFEASSLTGLPVDGNLIEANEQGNVTHSASSDEDIYVYDIFSDRNSVTTPQGFAIARVKKTDFLDALAMNKAPLFQKYYAPGGGYTEPGLGGSSTFVVTQGTDYIAWPEVIYCTYLNKYLLFYQTNQQSIQVRVSDNLMSWSAPITLFTSSSASLKTFYPTVAGTGPHPTVVGKTFQLYFQQRNATNPTNPNYYRCQVTIGP